MDKAELEKLKLEALRTLALEAGVANARALGKAELIAKLTPAEPEMHAPSPVEKFVERAREAVEHVVERVEEKAHAIADKLRHAEPHATHRDAGDTRVTTTTETTAEEAARREMAMGVPSSTVHPHAQPHQQQPPQAEVQQPPGEPMGMLDFEELPETYGVDECEVVAKDPHHVFAWWEVTDGGLDGARTQLGQSAASSRLVMRLFTTVPVNGHVERDIHDVDLTWNHGRRYLQAPRAGAHLRIAVGLLSSEGYFAPIAHSSLIRVPPTEPQPGPVEWMEVLPVRRDRARQPLVIVRRGGDHDERGVKFPGDGEDGGGGLGGSSPAAGERGGVIGWAGPSSSPTGGRNKGGG